MIPPPNLIAGRGAPGSVADLAVAGVTGRPELDNREYAHERHVLPDGDSGVHLVPVGYNQPSSTPWRAVDGGMCGCWPSVSLDRRGKHVVRVITHHPMEAT